MAKKTKKSKKKPIQKPSQRRLRGWFSLFFLFAAVVLVGTLWMRFKVINRVQSRAFQNASYVMSKPHIVSAGDNIFDIKLSSRLSRLGYIRTQSKPKKPGTYYRTSSQIQIYRNRFQLPTGGLESERFVSILFDSTGTISDVLYEESSRSVGQVALEPEIISKLGSSEKRAVDFKTLDQFPKQLKQAILSIEDERFYSHLGVDPIAILRAMVTNFKSGRVVQGGSTITQQLAKNLFYSSERSYTRKFFELFSALLIETAFSKEQILELYLNEVFLSQEGNTAVHGFGEASKSFFRKDIKNINLAEAATLAGLVKAPTSYSPRRNPKKSKTRRQVVLKQMKEHGKISNSEYLKAFNEKLKVFPKRNIKRVAPYFVDYVRKNINPSSFENEGIKLHTELDLEYQLCAENAVKSGLEKLEKARPKLKKQGGLQAALISLDSKTSSTRAWVGGRNYSLNQFDRVSQALRQPGSSFKPFVYLTALDRSLNNYRVARTTSILVDEPLTITTPGQEDWTPKNYDGKFRGEVTLRAALAKSLNIPTINLATKVGVRYIAHTAELFGFGRNLPQVPSLALGAGEVTPLSLARAYGGLSSGGKLRAVLPVVSITETESRAPLKTYKSRVIPAASPAATYVLTNILQSVIENGTGRVVRRLGFEGPAAGKTGTSNETRDAWFAGYTPSLLTVVWVGFDNNSETGLTGASGAAPIWAEYNKCVSGLEKNKRKSFEVPEGVVFKKIDRRTGLLATNYCPLNDIVTEVFVEGADPISPCSVHQRGNFRQRDEGFREPRDSYPTRRRHRKAGWLDWLSG